MGHFLSQDVQSWGDWIQGSSRAIGATITGVTGGGFDYSEAGRDFKNYGYDVYNAFTGKNLRDKGGKPLTADEIKKQNLDRLTDPNMPWNKVNWQVVSQHITNPRYSTSSGLGGVTKPSDIMSISDPATKMNIATTRGNARSAVQVVGNIRDAQMSSALSAVHNGGNVVQPNSDNVTSAGGQGIRTSNEQGQTTYN